MINIPAYRIEIRPLSEADGGGYLAWVPDLPGCMSDGETAAVAAQNAEQAILEWIDEAERLGRRLPKPSKAAVNSV
jgi:antitoxin HicB